MAGGSLIACRKTTYWIRLHTTDTAKDGNRLECPSAARRVSRIHRRLIVILPVLVVDPSAIKVD